MATTQTDRDLASRILDLADRITAAPMVTAEHGDEADRLAAEAFDAGRLGDDPQLAARMNGARQFHRQHGEPEHTGAFEVAAHYCWLSGRAPELGDLCEWAWNAAEVARGLRAVARVAGATSPAEQPRPITAAVACERYVVSRNTLGAAVRDGRLRDLRPPVHAKGAKLMVDENEVAARWAPRR